MCARVQGQNMWTEIFTYFCPLLFPLVSVHMNAPHSHKHGIRVGPGMTECVDVKNSAGDAQKYEDIVPVPGLADRFIGNTLSAGVAQGSAVGPPSHSAGVRITDSAEPMDLKRNRRRLFVSDTIWF